MVTGSGSGAARLPQNLGSGQRAGVDDPLGTAGGAPGRMENVRREGRHSGPMLAPGGGKGASPRGHPPESPDELKLVSARRASAPLRQGLCDVSSMS